jgi:hypothetical protein
MLHFLSSTAEDPLALLARELSAYREYCGSNRRFLPPAALCCDSSASPHCCLYSTSSTCTCVTTATAQDTCTCLEPFISVSSKRLMLRGWSLPSPGNTGAVGCSGSAGAALPAALCDPSRSDAVHSTVTLTASQHT